MELKGVLARLTQLLQREEPDAWRKLPTLFENYDEDMNDRSYENSRLHNHHALMAATPNLHTRGRARHTDLPDLPTAEARPKEDCAVVGHGGKTFYHDTKQVKIEYSTDAKLSPSPRWRCESKSDEPAPNGSTRGLSTRQFSNNHDYYGTLEHKPDLPRRYKSEGDEPTPDVSTRGLSTRRFSKNHDYYGTLEHKPDLPRRYKSEGNEPTPDVPTRGPSAHYRTLEYTPDLPSRRFGRAPPGRLASIGREPVKLRTSRRLV